MQRLMGGSDHTASQLGSLQNSLSPHGLGVRSCFSDLSTYCSHVAGSDEDDLDVIRTTRRIFEGIDRLIWKVATRQVMSREAIVPDFQVILVWWTSAGVTSNACNATSEEQE